ncbi:MAG: DUF4010 domain-containing protein [Alphaproteobacteria bacterium]|nr:DUF4010 domain-containing protein [Alphaproteobacteria bacterium]MDE2629992.1 DUF4010 domain-containing protein [Alphaproteobacteria bacterium]
MNAGIPPLELAWRLALVAALGIFLGLAFEETYKREDRTSPGGIRTFPMLALCGSMLYLVEPHYALAFVGGLLVLALWLYGAMRAVSEREPGPTLMIPASNLLAYVLGPIGLTQHSWIVVAVSVIAALLLGARQRLHELTKQLPQEEILTAGKFLILVGVVLPLVPNRPWTGIVPLTPYQVWLAVVAVCALSYMSYLIQKYVRIRNAALLPAILGGIYSSTATTIVLAKQLRDARGARPELTAGIVAATAIMYVRLGIIVALFNLRFALTLSPALGALFLAGAAISAFEWRRIPRSNQDIGLGITASNPLQISAAAIFAALFVIISVVSAWAKTALGPLGLFAVAAAVGVADIDPYVINIAQGGVPGMTPDTLSAAVLIAASSNNILKAVYSAAFGGWASAWRASLLLLVLAVPGFVAAYIYVA